MSRKSGWAWWCTQNKRQRQAELYEFKARLVYEVNSRPVSRERERKKIKQQKWKNMIACLEKRRDTQI